MKLFTIIAAVFFLCLHCSSNANNQNAGMPAATAVSPQYDSTAKTIHVLVALCDNKYQGIVPVPAKIGNGQDADNNLYWGCGYGVKTWFKKSSQWQLIQQTKGNDTLLERLVFKHHKTNHYLIADAYNGKYIQRCTIDFFNYCAGSAKDTVQLKNRVIGAGGNATLIAYTGHDGLMDFSLPQTFNHTDARKRDAIMLACISKKYFATHLRSTKANPLLWSTGLMSPEAYTLHDALEAYIGGSDVRAAAAKAYSRYQKCSIKAAQNLLVSGW